MLWAKFPFWSIVHMEDALIPRQRNRHAADLCVIYEEAGVGVVCLLRYISHIIKFTQI